MPELRNLKVLIKGAGEMATGIAHRLYMANITRIVMTEIPQPLTVRRTVAFSEAVHQGSVEVEGVRAQLVTDLRGIRASWRGRSVAVIVDPEWKVLGWLKPDIVVDAILAKRNLGTKKDEADLVIGVGPGFSAPAGVHAVVESNRGHDLGRVIYDGFAEPHTGIPGPVMGVTKERVLRSPHGGPVRHAGKIGDMVKKGDIILYVGETALCAPINGVLRGLISEMEVAGNEKVGDIDPRGKVAHCFTITEKARAIGGGVLEAVMHKMNYQKEPGKPLPKMPANRTG
jgi:xanthine dehydrogenase accessory factor